MDLTNGPDPSGRDTEGPRLERLVLGPWATNCYIISDPTSQEATIVDPAADPDKIVNAVASYKPRQILLTHGHMDHSGAVASLKGRLGLPVGLHRLDAGLAQIVPDLELKDGGKLSLGQMTITVLHTPGHTPGSLTFLVGNDALVGDLIFPGGPGATRTPIDFGVILRSITAKILPLPEKTRLHPGHGDGLNVARARQEVSAFLCRPAKANLCGEVHWTDG